MTMRMPAMQTHQATFRTDEDIQQPAPDSTGKAWPACGSADPFSAEYGAWLFQPDGDENAYYVAEHELEFIN